MSPVLSTQPGAEPATGAALTSSDRARALVKNYAIFLVFILLLVAGSFLSDRFLSTQNLLNIGQSVAFTGFAALGMLFVTTSGGFVDLSIPASMASSGIIALAFMPTLGVLGGVIIGIIAGVVIGSVNGTLIGIFRTNPVLTTLGTNVAFLGISLIFTQGDIVYSENEFFSQFAQDRTLGIPNTLWILAAVAVLAHVILTYTVLGRWIYPTGGNYAAARAAGVPVRRVMVSVFVICATFSAIGGILLASINESARSNAGLGQEFNAISAVAIGGNSIFGGAGTVPRTIIGVLIVGVLNNLMILVGIPAESQNIVKGALIVGAVLLDLRLRR
jgi:ribose/xylose/arabinose/galactoside ABC-type transport system permease subunit